MMPIAPPFPNANAFYCRFFVDVGGYLDEDQRRLHEVDFRDECDAQSYGPCPFHDSRQGYLINKAALRQIACQWDRVIKGVRFFTALTGGAWSGEPALERAWRITVSTMFAPLYLLNRRGDPFANGHLPVSVAGVFKILLDVPTTIDLMLLEDANESAAASSPLAIREFADNKLVLLNGAFACAGSPRLIDEVVHVLLDDADEDWGADAEFRSYFPRNGEFLQFAYAMSCQYVVGLPPGVRIDVARPQ